MSAWMTSGPSSTPPESERSFLVSESEGAALAAVFAATAPERVAGLVFYAPLVRIIAEPDFPWGHDRQVFDAYVRSGEEHWGDGTMMGVHAPSAAAGGRETAFWGRFERMAMSPGGFVDHMRVISEIDIRSVLPSISTPTLVVHRRDDATIPIGQGRYLAEHVAGARLVELDGIDHQPMAGDAASILTEIEAFVTGTRPVERLDVDRVLMTVLFTDIVGSTERAVVLGDDQWHRLLDQHDADVARVVGNFGGQAIKTTGDGVLATFDRPARAIRCASELRRATRPLGIELRAGLHTGEVELRDGDVAGIAVNTAARVQAHAGPSEVLVSRTVVDLVAGSGLSFDDRGEHDLKGVPGTVATLCVERLSGGPRRDARRNASAGRGAWLPCVRVDRGGTGEWRRSAGSPHRPTSRSPGLTTNRRHRRRPRASRPRRSCGTRWMSSGRPSEQPSSWSGR